MEASTHILLISSDLMVASRIDGLARSAGARLETVASLQSAPQAGPFDIVLLDLQSLAGDAVAIVGRVRSMLDQLPAQAATPAKVIAFGPHVHKQRLDDATTAGATLAVSRGELLGDFPAVIARAAS
ncbi:MAG: hypothetical protein ACKOEX_07500, partial [Planctomycetia bacterium]